MYSTMMMIALATSPQASDCCFHGGYGGYGYGYGGCYGCYGYGGFGMAYGYSLGYGYGGYGLGYGGYGYSGFSGYSGYGVGYGGYSGSGYGISGGYNSSTGYPSTYGNPTSYGYLGYSPPSPNPARTYAETAPARQQPASLPAPAVAQAKATVEVILPPEAKLYVDARPMTSTGELRRLTSPPIEANQDFTYLLTATVMRDGNEVKVEKRITVRAGQTTQVSLQFPYEVAGR